MLSHFTKIVVFSLICFIIEIGLLRADTTEDLSHKLAIIDQKCDGLRTNTQGLKSECLGLLADVNTPEDSGAIYTEIAMIYGQSGLTQPESTSAYCELALHYPLADTTAARLYVVWADALHVLHEDKSFEVTDSSSRIEIARICLNGLKLIMLHDLPESRQALPSVPVIHYFGSDNDPDNKELMEMRNKAIERRKKIEEQNALIQERNILIDKLAYLSKTDPGTKKEIERLTRDILQNDDAKEVLALIEKKLSAD